MQDKNIKLVSDITAATIPVMFGITIGGVTFLPMSIRKSATLAGLTAGLVRVGVAIYEHNKYE